MLYLTSGQGQGYLGWSLLTSLELPSALRVSYRVGLLLRPETVALAASGIYGILGGIIIVC